MTPLSQLIEAALYSAARPLTIEELATLEPEVTLVSPAAWPVRPTADDLAGICADARCPLPRMRSQGLREPLSSLPLCDSARRERSGVRLI